MKSDPKYVTLHLRNLTAAQQEEIEVMRVDFRNAILHLPSETHVVIDCGRATAVCREMVNVLVEVQRIIRSRSGNVGCVNVKSDAVRNAILDFSDKTLRICENSAEVCGVAVAA